MKLDRRIADRPTLTGSERSMSDRNPRLLVVTVGLTGGGAERFASTLIRHLHSGGVEIGVAATVDEVTYPMPDGIPIEIIGYRSKLDLLRSVGRLREMLSSFQPDSVLSILSGVGTLTGLALRRSSSSARWVARIGAPPSREGRMQRFTVRWTITRADAVVPNAAGMVDEVHRYYRVPYERIRVAYTPLDIDWLEEQAEAETGPMPEGHRPVLVWIGRLRRQKRPDLLLEAFEEIRNRVDAELWICGTGPLRDETERRAQASRFADDIRMPGFLDNPFPLMKSASIALLTSDYEGLPNALVESQALGVPGVSTDCLTGPAEVIAPGETGLLTPPGDARAFAGAVLDLLSDAERRKAMGRAAAALARRRFGLEEQLSKWAEILGVASGLTANKGG